MLIKMDGKNLSSLVKEEIKTEIDLYKNIPCLAVISVGEDSASKIYINNKKKSCEEVGIAFMSIHFDAEAKEKDIISKIEELNEDKNVSGIIVQLPLPSKFDEYKLLNTVSVEKDVDGLTDLSKGRAYMNTSFIPCTAKGIMKLFDYYKIDLESKLVVIVGRSDLVGKPVARECLKRNATVIICHSKTKNLKDLTKQADILVAAAGKKYLIDKTMVKKDAVVIDVGINYEDTKIYGDVNKDVEDVASYMTPVPGGVGPMTVVMLLKNTLEAFKNNSGIKYE